MYITYIFWIALLSLTIIPLTIIFGICWWRQAVKTRQLRELIWKLVKEGRITKEEAMVHRSIKGKTEGKQPVKQTLHAEIKKTEPVNSVVSENSPPKPQVQPGKTPTNIILIIGVFFIILSGLIFATTTWQFQTSATKVLMLFLSSTIFFAASIVAQKKFKLRQTAATFYSLGSIFLPISILAIGFFQLFGFWFSLYGEGRWMIGAFAFFLLSVTMACGHYIYKKNGLDWVSIFCVGLTIICIALYVKPDLYCALFALVLYTMVLFLCDKIWPEKLTVYADCMLWVGATAAAGTSFIAFLSFTPTFDFLLIISMAMMTALITHKAIKYPSTSIFRYLQPVFFMILIVETMKTMKYLFHMETHLFFCMIMLIAFLFSHRFIIKGTEIKPLKSMVSEIIFPVSVFLSYLFVVDHGSSLCISLVFFLMLAYQAQERKEMRYIITYVAWVPIFHLGEILQVQNGILTALAYFLVLICIAWVPIFTDRWSYWNKMKQPLFIGVNVVGVFFTAYYLSVMEMKLFPLFAIGVSVMWTLQYWKENNMLSFYIAAGLWPCTTMIISYAAFDGMEMKWIFLIAAVIVSIYAIPKRISKPSLKEETKNAFFRVSMIGAYGTSLITVGLYLSQQGSSDFLYGIVSILLAFYAYALWHKSKITLPMIIPMIFIYSAILKMGFYLFQGNFDHLSSQNLIHCLLAAMFFLFLLAGKMFYKKVYIKFENRILLDCLTIVAIITPFKFILSDMQQWRFMGWLLLAIYGSRFIHRLDTPTKSNMAKLACAISLCISFYVQPFIEWPDIFKFKIYLFFPLLLWLTSSKYIWRERQKTIHWVGFGYCIWIFAALLMEALISGRIFDALFVGIAALIILLFSLKTKNKRWFLLSACALAIIAVYLSRGLWLSITWWVYLLLAGSLLIGVAIANEINRQKGIKLSDKVHDIFIDWK